MKLLFNLGDYQSYDVWTSGSSSLYFRLQESGSSGLTSIQDVGQHESKLAQNAIIMILYNFDYG